MEMKYLKEQDTGQIYMPVVHRDGIVGLDPSGSDPPSVYTSVYIQDDDQGITGSISFTEYSKIVLASLKLYIDPDGAAYETLKSQNNVSISIDMEYIYSYLVFDTIAYNEGKMSTNVPTSAWLGSDKILHFNAGVKANNYTPNIDGVINEQYTYNPIDYIIGTAIGIVIGGTE